ncbi:type VI secretion system tip protein VgrG [Lelliottia sp. WB101]|uniref:type VI secretion system tip protein TssI/VgrG n=1 Tax=Lelliottia sp. WB101 TaxID=2153385 RepID=UPI000D2208EB|nr:type VI secretion system tip protein TssI/VgrG [Lelliottia sp. WB101]AVY98125.1 type VI secretion system tip protein VgrG [Lelliottia sp. WB101]
MSEQGLRFTLEVEGQKSWVFAVYSFSLSRHYSLPFVLDVELTSKVFDLTAQQLLEKEATLTIWQGSDKLHEVCGLIALFGMKESNKWQQQYSLRIHPPLWRASLRQNFRIFQQQDIQTITATLLRENGITGWQSTFHEVHPAREFCVQYGESDLAFLTRLWAEEGIFYFDQTQSGKNVLSLIDDVFAVDKLDALSFNPNSVATIAACISEFRYRAQIRPSSVATKDYTFECPIWSAFYEQHGDPLNGQRWQYEIFDYPGRFKDEQHGADFARYQLEGWRSDAETALCTSNSPALFPGKCFTLNKHPSKSLNREWQVVRSWLRGSQPQALLGSTGEGTTLENRLEVIPADRTWRSAPLPKPSVDGPQSAIVTGPEGEEIFCDEHGRVRVSFRWDRYNRSDEHSSCWIRVVQAWAGANYGNIAIPRVGHEVIVDFLNGDPDQPIIMGRTYHNNNRTPGLLPGTKTQMIVRSKTYKGDGFNELKFDDATGRELVYIHAQKNMDTDVLHNRTTDVKVDHTETIGNNQSINVGLGQTIQVGKKNADGHDQNITVAHNQRISVHNDQTVRITNDRVMSIDHNDVLYVVNDRKVTVDGTQHHKTSGNHSSLVEGKCSLQVKGDLAQKISGALGIHVQGDIVLKSSGSISLNAGSSFIVIHAGGVDINGPKINLNSGGSARNIVRTIAPDYIGRIADSNSTSTDSPWDEKEGESDSPGGKDDGEKYYSKSNDELYNLHFAIINENDGKPLAEFPYEIVMENGSRIKGVTDERGCTDLMTSDSEYIATISIYEPHVTPINPEWDE